MWQLRRNMVDHFDNRVAEGLYLIDDGIGFDGDYGFPLATDEESTKPNQLYKGGEKLRVQTHNPHPDIPGAHLLGNSLVGFIQYLRK